MLTPSRVCSIVCGWGRGGVFVSLLGVLCAPGGVFCYLLCVWVWLVCCCGWGWFVLGCCCRVFSCLCVVCLFLWVWLVLVCVPSRVVGVGLCGWCWFVWVPTVVFRVVGFRGCGFFVGVVRFSCLPPVFVCRALGFRFSLFRPFVLSKFLLSLLGFGGLGGFSPCHY